MARHLLFLAALILLFSLSCAVPPVSVPPNGKFNGYLKSNNEFPDPTGDWLTSTLCYCHSPIRVSDAWQDDYKYEKAHIFQHEYYNFHSNVTFVTNHMCLSKAHYQGDQCVHPNVGGDNNDWRMEGRFTCKKFKRTDDEKRRQVHSKRSTRRGKRRVPHMPTMPHCLAGFESCDKGTYAPDPEDKSNSPDHDKVCFSTDTGFYGKDEFDVKFNRQRRRMVKALDQGRIQTDSDSVRGYCEDLCQSHFKMPVDMYINDKRAGGGCRQFVYTDVDDMCDHCK